jgi:hypothetical protein
MRLAELVNHFKNKKNSQEKLEIKKLELKKYNISVNDILNLKINQKLKKFDEM